MYIVLQTANSKQQTANYDKVISACQSVFTQFQKFFITMQSVLKLDVLQGVLVWAWAIFRAVCIDIWLCTVMEIVRHSEG